MPLIELLLAVGVCSLIVDAAFFGLRMASGAPQATVDFVAVGRALFSGGVAAVGIPLCALYAASRLRWVADEEDRRILLGAVVVVRGGLEEDACVSFDRNVALYRKEKTFVLSSCGFDVVLSDGEGPSISVLRALRRSDAKRGACLFLWTLLCRMDRLFYGTLRRWALFFLTLVPLSFAAAEISSLLTLADASMFRTTLFAASVGALLPAFIFLFDPQDYLSPFPGTVLRTPSRHEALEAACAFRDAQFPPVRT